MGRAPCCTKVGLHKGPWTPREDALLTKYLQAHGEGQWKSLPKKAGLLRCGKSCRLRWMNYLRPDIKRGNISPQEDDLIIRMHSLIGNRWSLIAGRLPGRTDNEIKNYWNTHLSKKLRNQNQGPDPKEKPASASKKKKKKKKNGGKKKNKKNKGSVDEESEKTKVYLPKPIRVKPLTLPRTDSTFTFDSNSGSASTNQENKLESTEGTKEVMNVVCEGGNVEPNLEFDFFSEDHDLVKGLLDVESQSDFPADHCTLKNLYEEYFQLLDMEDSQISQYELDSFAECLLV